MSETSLQGRHILIVEDDFLLAIDLKFQLEDAGATIIGMASTIAEALALVAQSDHLDGVVLDVNLGGELIFPVADALVERRIPFLFTTGYDASIIPPRFTGIVRHEKPINLTKVVSTIGEVMAA